MPAALVLGPRLDLLDRRAQDPVLDGLPLAVHVLETKGETLCLRRVVRQQQLERLARMTETPRGVDTRREAEADGAFVDRGGIDACDLHQGAQPGLLRARERAKTGAREGAVLVDQRHDVGDRRESDQVLVLRDGLAERLGELRHDAGAAELGKRVLGRTRGDHWAVRELVARPVVVGEDETAAVVREAVERLAGEAVAFVEAAGKVPIDVGSEGAQAQEGERGGADAVDVVVTVHADPLAGPDRGTDRLDCTGHVPQQGRVVSRWLRRQERARARGIAVAPPDEDARGELAEPELARQRFHFVRLTRFDRPTAVLHGRFTLRVQSDGKGMCALSGYSSARVIHRAVILVVFVALACAAAPGATQIPTIPPGVIVGGIYVGDLTSEPARAQLTRSFTRQIPVFYGKQRWFASPEQLGAGAAIDRAVARALDARPGKQLRVHVRWSGRRVKAFVDRIAQQVDRDAVDAELVSVSATGPVISNAKQGVAVRRALFQRRLERALAHSLRTRVAVPTRPVEAERTRAKFGPVNWISRGSNTLRLYDGCGSSARSAS